MQRIRLNVRLLAILVVGVIVIGVGIFLVNRFQVRRQADANLTRARQLVEKTKSVEAPEQRFKISAQTLRAYRQYLQSHPEDVDVQLEEALFLKDQGEWLFENGDKADAFKLISASCQILENALRQAEGRQDVRKKFVDILFEVGDYKTTVQHIRFLSDLPEDRVALEKLFDRYDLWNRAIVSGRIEAGVGNDRDLSPFLGYDKKSVDQDRLMDFLGDDLWMVLEDPNLLNTLGQCYLGLNNSPSAIKALEKAVTLRPDNLDAYDALIKALRAQERSEDVGYWCSEVVEANPDMARAYLIRGQDSLYRASAIGQEDASAVLASAEWDALRASQKAAQRIVESADRIIPNAEVAGTLNNDFNSVMDLAPAPGKTVTASYRNALLKVVANVGPAVELMKKKLSEREEKKGENASDLTETFSAFETMIDKDLAGCRDGLLLAVECETQRSFLDKENSKKHIQAARNLAKAVLSLFPEEAQVYLTLADIELRVGSVDQMINWLIRGTQNAKDDTALLWRLGTALATSGKTKEAKEILTQLIASGEKQIFVDHLQAALDYNAGNWSAAAAKFEKVRPEFITSPTELRKIDILLARCYEKLGRVNDQREAFARAASFDRTWGPAILGLARSRAASGQSDEAIKDYQVILKLPDIAPSIYLEYAQVLLDYTAKKPKTERNYGLVEDAIEQASAVMSDSPLIPVIRAELLIAKGEVEKARRLLTALHEELGAAKEKVLQERKVLLKEAESLTGSQRDAKLEEAKGLLAKSQAYDAQKPQVWERLIVLASQQGDWQAANQTLQEAEKRLGDTPAIRYLRAQKLFRESGKDAAIALHSLAENTDHFERTQKLNLFRCLASMAISLNDLPQAEKLAREVCRVEASDVEMQKILFHIARSEKDLDGMKAILGNIRKIETKASAFWYYGEAMRLYLMSKESDNSQLVGDAVNLLQKASRMEPLWASPTLLLAQIYQEQGKAAEATDLYMNAVQNGMQNPMVIRNVARLLTRQRRYQEADQMFSRLVQLRGGHGQGVGMSASYVKAQLGDFTQAIDMARKACENSDSYEDFLWLGRVLSVAAKRDSEENRNAQAEKLYGESEQSLLKAIELESSAAEAWVGLVQLYGWFGKKEEANKALEQAKSAIPADEVDLALAQAYETLGDLKKAGIYYRKAIRNAPKNANIARIAALFFLKNDFSDESKMLLKRIANKQVDANDQQVAWAKRTLGVLMVRESGVGDITETIKLIDENLKANPNSVLDLYTKASLLAHDPTGLYSQEAIMLFERIRTQLGDPGIIIQQELADLYYDAERWDDFKTTMQTLLGKSGDNPKIVRRYIARLLKRGEYGEANIWLEQLKSIMPEDVSPFFMECDLVFAQKRYDDLLKMINAWVESPDQKNDTKERFGTAAVLYQKYALKLQDEHKVIPAQKFERQAENSMLKYVELVPKAELDLAVLYAQQNKFDRAVFILRKMASNNQPQQLGMAVYRMIAEGGLPKEQIAQVRDILKPVSNAHSDNVSLKMMLALCEEQLGEFMRAESVLRSALRKEPENVDLMNYLAVSLALNGKKLDEARDLIEKAIQTAGPLPDLLDSRAIVSIAQDHPKAALNDLRRAIAKKPSASFYFHLAEALNQGGMRRPAMKALEKAQKLGLREKTLMPIERRNYRRLKLSLQ